VPIINVELTQVEQRERSKKSVKVKRAWKESGYGAVIKHFCDNKDLEFVGNMVFALLRLETTIIEELLDLDGEVTNDDVRSCVLENVARWNEHLGIMARKLKVSGDLAWKEFDKIDSSNQEVD
jgi:hypothetical protein